MSTEPLVVYFSGPSENTKYFVERLPFNAVRIPLTRKETPLEINRDFVLATPTYGAGNGKNAVPKQIVKFFRNEAHKQHCLGVIGGGNRLFGHDHYVLAARIIAQLLNVPLLSTFEIRGMQRDVDETTKQIEQLWGDIRSTKGTP